MRTYIGFLLMISLSSTTIENFAQCPTNESTFASGGTYSGDCILAVGLEVNITGTVNWTSGTLTITGGSGRIIVDNGAVLNIQGGEIVTIDDGNSNGNTDGPIVINSGGTINVALGAGITCAESITVDGTFNIGGRVESLRSSISISSGGSVYIPPGGDLTTFGTGDNSIQGSLIIEGSLAANGDIEIDGGDVMISDNSTLVVNNDLYVYGGGSIQIDPLGVAEVTGRVANADDSPGFPTLSGSGSIEVAGSLLIGDDLAIYNTTPDSELTGFSGGEITVSGSFSDAECPTYVEDAFTYCDCTGGGDPCSAALPVELISFTAEQHANAIVLNWITATELNNDYFTLERFNDLDQLSTLTSIPGKGTAVQITNYNFIDTAPLSGINYYRLKQTDFNGSFSYSKVVKVDFVPEKNELLVYPNPLTGKSVSIHATGFLPLTNLKVFIRSADGDTCFFENVVTNESGSFSKVIDVSQMSSGIYIISAGKLNTKLVK